MPRTLKGTYYLGRVIKGGRLDKDMFISSLLEPLPIVRGKHAWTFIKIEVFETKEGEILFVYGKLSKYSPDAEVKIVEPALHTEVTRREPNLSIATVPFVYIPAHSGIAFLHDARHISQYVFIDRFKEIIEETNENFFVSCEIELIADLQSFAAKLARLDGIFEISASIFPPNPLFGTLWKPLKDYMEGRDVGAMEIKEEAKSDEAINTDLPKHVAEVAGQDENKSYSPGEPLPLGDAAILMAADGYGTGTIKGQDGDRFVTISTAETARNFSFDRDPDPKKLFEAVNRIFEEIEQKRHLKH